MSRWIAYSDSDAASWAPDLSPDKAGSERWTGAAPGCLVCLVPVQINGATWFLPGVYFGDGRKWDGTGWLHSERAYPSKDLARKEAIERYRVNVPR